MTSFKIDWFKRISSNQATVSLPVRFPLKYKSDLPWQSSGMTQSAFIFKV